ASWWPKKSLMKFERQGQGPVQTGTPRINPCGIIQGTRYRQVVLLPFAPSWNVEVEKLTDQSITRRFLNGMFCGSETVSLQAGTATVASPGSLEVHYVMHYRLNGVLNKILWPLVFERLHNRNIEAILQSLKLYLEKEC
ncbi:MAG: hypothetical protein V1863_01090, partial [Candidatus Omnitrophota bacterium]